MLHALCNHGKQVLVTPSNECGYLNTCYSLGLNHTAARPLATPEGLWYMCQHLHRIIITVISVDTIIIIIITIIVLSTMPGPTDSQRLEFPCVQVVQVSKLDLTISRRRVKRQHHVCGFRTQLHHSSCLELCVTTSGYEVQKTLATHRWGD